MSLSSIFYLGYIIIITLLQNVRYKYVLRNRRSWILEVIRRTQSWRREIEMPGKEMYRVIIHEIHKKKNKKWI